jgi:hypothetical protein
MIHVGKETYCRRRRASYAGQKGQAPPDLRYFKQSPK